MPFVLGNAALKAAEAKKKRPRINVENVLIADAAQVPMPDAVRKQFSSSNLDREALSNSINKQDKICQNVKGHFQQLFEEVS